MEQSGFGARISSELRTAATHVVDAVAVRKRFLEVGGKGKYGASIFIDEESEKAVESDGNVDSGRGWLRGRERQGGGNGAKDEHYHFFPAQHPM